MHIKQLNSIEQISAAEWNHLVDPAYPFIRHEFLVALEQSGAVSVQTGWQVAHLLVSDDETILAILPLYVKRHSRGEYVFDQQWAAAYQHYGVDYYPKLLTAIPFTPCQGQRLLLRPDCDVQMILSLLLAYLQEWAVQDNLSSWHCLFPVGEQLECLHAAGLSIREAVQFHWFNQGYSDFNAYLLSLTASKRKMIKRERRLVTEQGITLQRILGPEITEQQWQVFFKFYMLTYQKKGGQAYLNLAFFKQIAVSMSNKLLLVLAIKEGNYVAAALSFIGEDCLYGRYWGCYAEFSVLHFEACYYQGIEYCIEQGLQRFDSGAQGEHKIARGFQPITTYSAHWMQDSRFAQAIADFLLREQQAVAQYKLDAASYLPFKQSEF
jgi:predicted N-acyltransferase